MFSSSPPLPPFFQILLFSSRSVRGAQACPVSSFATTQSLFFERSLPFPLRHLLVQGLFRLLSRVLGLKYLLSPVRGLLLLAFPQQGLAARGRTFNL